MTIWKVDPSPLALCTRTEPWWASAMACTMGRPSPNPPTSRLRDGSARGEAPEDGVRGVAGDGGLGDLAEAPVPRHVAPSLQRVEDQGIGGHRRHLQEARGPGRGQQ